MQRYTPEDGGSVVQRLSEAANDVSTSGEVEFRRATPSP